MLSDMLQDRLATAVGRKKLTFKVYELPIVQETTEKNTAEAKAEESNEYAWQPRRRVRTSVIEAACTPAR